MISSQFIADILDLMLDGDADGHALRPQIPFLVEGEIEYSERGFCLTFTSLDGIENYRYLGEDIAVGSISLESPDYCAHVNSGWLDLWTKNGLISCLQFIGHYDGYPQHDLENYLLRQAWKDEPGREIVRGIVTLSTHD